MAITAYCPTCERTVYIEDDSTPVCPVCSTPLLETKESDEVTAKEKGGKSNQG